MANPFFEHPILNSPYACPITIRLRPSGYGATGQRRVHVVAMTNPSVVLAVITWGWEPLTFYRQWGNFPKTKKDAENMKGPSLALLNTQSAVAPALLDVAKEVLLSSPEYVERIKQHYALFRATIDR